MNGCGESASDVKSTVLMSLISLVSFQITLNLIKVLLVYSEANISIQNLADEIN